MYLFSVVTGEDEKNPCQILCSHISVFSFTAWISLAHHEVYTGYVPMDYREYLKKMPKSVPAPFHYLFTSKYLSIRVEG